MPKTSLELICPKTARQLEACLITSVTISRHVLILSVLFLPARPCSSRSSHSGRSGLHLVHWETYLPCESPQAGGVLGLAVIPGSHCSRKKENWNPATSARGGTRPMATGEALPALGGKGLGLLSGQLPTSDPSVPWGSFCCR